MRSKTLILIFAAAALLRLGYAAFSPVLRNPVRAFDLDRYAAIASSFAQTGCLCDEGAPTASREPIFPILLGSCFKIFGEHALVLVILNTTLGLACLWLLYQVGLTLFGETTARLALIIAAIYPPFIFYSAQPQRETMMALMGIWMVKTWIDLHTGFNDAKRQGEIKRLSLRTGVVNVLAALTNTTFLPFALIIAPVTWLYLTRKRLKAALRLAVMYMAILVAGYSIWPLRNYIVFRTWILGSTAGAASTFYIYLVVPQAMGGTPAQEEILARDPVVAQAANLSATEREHYYWKAALKRVANNPGSYAKLFCARVADYWRLWPRPRPYGHDYALVKWVSILTDGWIIPLGLLGLLAAFSISTPVAWLIGYVAALNALYAAIFTMIRYRFSVMPWIILFAAAMIVKIAAWARLRSFSRV